MAEKDVTVKFISTATIYRGGPGHPVPPGRPAAIPEAHAAAFRAMGLEKATEKPAADAAADKSSAKK